MDDQKESDVPALIQSAVWGESKIIALVQNGEVKRMFKRIGSEWVPVPSAYWKHEEPPKPGPLLA